MIVRAARGGQCALPAVGAVVLSVAIVFLLRSHAAPGVQAAMPLVTGSMEESFVYRFDPDISSFTFTFTVPTRNASPWDVVVVSDTGSLNVWFTESGADRIGRLVYTDTDDYVFHEYTVTVGSQPLNLVSGGGSIWFTAADGDYIGRLEPTTGQIDEFGVTEGSYPADLDYAPDGSIWFTEMAADRVGHLVVAPSAGFTVTEYTSPITSAGRGWPYGIVVVGGSVLFAHPRELGDCVTRFTPPASWIDITGLVNGVPDEPHRLAVTSLGQVWGTERTGNGVSLFGFGTMPIVNRYGLTPTNSMPTGLAVDANNHLWFTQWRAGQIGRLKPGGNPQKDYFPMPLAGLNPTGIATDSTGGIWVLASRPDRVHLPFVTQSWKE
jgi:virginiamycin B lyase